MSYADPHACPSCSGVIDGQPRCPHCGFNLASPPANQLWQTLLQADTLLEEARRKKWTTTPDKPLVPTDVPLPRPGPAVPVEPVIRQPRWSTGSIILGLGALCLIVAALVFITVSWDVLGATGRTLVLLAITLAIAGVAAWSTRKSLRASAESLWTVFLGFFTIDYFAARSYDLFGLDSLNVEHAVLLYGVLAAVLGGAIGVFSARTMTLRAPAVVAGLAVWIAAFSLGASVDWSFFWRAIAALALATVAAVIAWRVHLRLTLLIAGAAAALLYVIAAGGAIAVLADHPRLHSLAADGHGAPMVVMIVLTVVIGLLAPKLRMPATAFAVLGAASLAFTPAEAGYPHEGGFISASILAVVLACVLIRGSNHWIQGARLGGAAILLALTTASLGWLGNAGQAISEGGDHGFSSAWGARLANGTDLPGPGWLAFTAFAAMAVSAFAVLRWPESRPYSEPLRPLPFFVAAFGIGAGIIAYEPPAILATGVVLLLGIGLLLMTRKRDELWQAASLLIVAVPALMALVSESATLTAWTAVAATLAAVAAFWKVVWLRQVSAFASAGLALGVVALAVDLGSFTERDTRIFLLVASILVLDLGTYLLRSFVGRIEVEAAGGLGMAAVLVSAVDAALGSQALLWTVAGASIALLGLLVADRRWFRLIGTGLLGVAWVLRLLASDVGTIEAYTAPFAFVLLAGGLWAMRKDTSLRTLFALTPGLSLALLPSIPQALEDPTGKRALYLGVAAAVALAAGIWRKWQMPFVFGSVVLALLVVWNVGPLANGLPRWILIAAAGIVLVGSGITWENRVRNARSAAQYIKNLR